MSRGEEKSDHCGAKLFILPGNIWRPGLGPDCFIWLPSYTLATFGIDWHVSCLFLPPRLGQVHSWSTHCPALTSWGAFPKHALQQQLWAFLTQNSLAHFPPWCWWIEKPFQATRLYGVVAKSRCGVEMWGKHILQKNCLFCPKGGLCPPLFCGTKQTVLVSSMDDCWSEEFAFFFFICFCPFLLPTQDTLWQRGCKKQPGLAASLPQFYIPGLLFLKQFMPWSMDRLFRITEGTFPVRENFSSVLTWSLFSLLPQGARPTARAHLAIQGRCCCPGLELRH